MLLVCSNRCGGEIFRSLNVEVEIDAAGNYQDHHILQPIYVCAGCGSPAVDLSEVRNAIAEERAEDEPADTVDVLCPVCETPVTVGPDLECPNCGAELELEVREY